MDITLLNEVWDLIISAFSPLRKRFSRDGTVWESSPVQWDLARYSVSLSFPLPAGIFLEPALSSLHAGPPRDSPLPAGIFLGPALFSGLFSFLLHAGSPRDSLYWRAFSLDWPSPLASFLPFLHAAPSRGSLYRRAFFLGQPPPLTPFLPFLHAVRSLFTFIWYKKIPATSYAARTFTLRLFFTAYENFLNLGFLPKLIKNPKIHTISASSWCRRYSCIRCCIST